MKITPGICSIGRTAYILFTSEGPGEGGRGEGLGNGSAPYGASACQGRSSAVRFAHGFASGNHAGPFGVPLVQDHGNYN
jgi:hypothetical protein